MEQTARDSKSECLDALHQAVLVNGFYGAGMINEIQRWFKGTEYNGWRYIEFPDRKKKIRCNYADYVIGCETRKELIVLDKYDVKTVYAICLDTADMINEYIHTEEYSAIVGKLDMSIEDLGFYAGEVCRAFDTALELGKLGVAGCEYADVVVWLAEASGLKVK
ncbi:MAG: hypothetical protein HF308_19295 [Ignavibacteria bacterium]|nr:hypothetical protein [Ignavibacteria bacterium]MCU7526627.1 hypothetical protein [Ignavibacteria bacterium]